jgi:rifampicin phosphotransferase
VVDRRRAVWSGSHACSPPDHRPAPRLLAKELLEAVDAVRTTGRVPENAIVGQPASPGRATGPVRIVHGPDDFDHFQPGEVLVARATTPAWTPLVAHAVEMVTDGGSLAAHPSLVAREYGIPAVATTEDATTHLADGQIVTIDGGASGTVHPTTDRRWPHIGQVADWSHRG